MTTFDPYHAWLGLSQSGRPHNHYQLLGLRPFAGDERLIARAAKIRLAHVRQFAGGIHAGHASKILSELLLASRCLLNPELKQDYDRRLRGERRRGSAGRTRLERAPL